MTNTTIQRPDILTRYTRAAALTKGIFSSGLTLNTHIVPNWLAGSDQFWYSKETVAGKQFTLVDPVQSSFTPLFDHTQFSQSLAHASQETVDPENLPITIHHIDRAQSTITFTAFDQRWVFDQNTLSCTANAMVAIEGRVSPNGEYQVFTQDHNLWLSDHNGKQQRALTDDGEADNAYGAVGTSWGMDGVGWTGPQALWSPDSQTILTVKRDRRHVKPLPVVHHQPDDGSLRPHVEQIKIAYPGDEAIEQLSLYLIDSITGHSTPVAYPSIPVTRNSQGFFVLGLGWWGHDSQQAYFIDVAQDYRSVKVLAVDVASGATRCLFEEHSATQVNLNSHADENALIAPLPETNELIWFSERSGWGHLYLYDLNTGALKNTITQGEWLVRNILSVNTARREVVLQTCGRTPERDPYYRDIIRVNIDTGEQHVIASSDHHYTVFSWRNHAVEALGLVRALSDTASGVSPSGEYLVATQSRADERPVNCVLDREGRTVMALDEADLSPFDALFPDGWHWPEPVQTVSADGKTPIYGLIYRPSYFSPSASYPVIDLMLCSPDFPAVCKGAFVNNGLYDLLYLSAMALAELGFIVVQIDGRGTSGRSKAFQDESYGRIYTASHLDDHVAAIQQLGARYPFMDLNRVGASTHAADGTAALVAVSKYPDFYKVGVNFGCLDHRLTPSAMWDNKYHGVANESGDANTLEAMASTVTGKLLLMHGMLDTSCPPTAIFRLAEAFKQANKAFDLLLLPKNGHEPCSYMVRRTWDYFVTHLLEEEVPVDFSFSYILDAG